MIKFHFSITYPYVYKLNHVLIIYDLKDREVLTTCCKITQIFYRNGQVLSLFRNVERGSQESF